MVTPIEIVTEQMSLRERFKIPYNYQDVNVSSKVLRLIVGLTKQVKGKYHGQQ